MQKSMTKSLSIIPVDISGTIVGESPNFLFLSGTLVGENLDHVCWDVETHYSNDTSDYNGTESTENLVWKIRTLTPYRHQKCPLGPINPHSPALNSSQNSNNSHSRTTW